MSYRKKSEEDKQRAPRRFAIAANPRERGYHLIPGDEWHNGHDLSIWNGTEWELGFETRIGRRESAWTC